MIKCPKCGKGMSSEEIFCPHCGYMMSMEERENAQPYNEKQVTSSVNQSQQQSSNQAPSHTKPSYSSSNSRPAAVDEGSVAVGFILSFFLGLIGFVIALVVGKKKTMKGASIGFGFFLGLAVIAGIIIGSKVL